MDKEQLIEKCRFYANDALSEAQKWKYETGTMRITRLLNAEHSIGKFHAYLEMLQEMDMEAFCMIHDETRLTMTGAIELLQNLYNKFKMYGESENG